MLERNELMNKLTQREFRKGIIFSKNSEWGMKENGRPEPERGIQNS
jgi:hypothetical protein